MDEQLKIFLSLVAVFAVIAGYVLFQSGALQPLLGAGEKELRQKAAVEAETVSDTVLTSYSRPESFNITRTDAESGSAAGATYGQGWVKGHRMYAITVDFSSLNGVATDRVEKVNFAVMGAEAVGANSSRRQALKNVIERNFQTDISNYVCWESQAGSGVPAQRCVTNSTLDNGRRMFVGGLMTESFPSRFHVQGCIKTKASDIYNADTCIE